MNAGRARAVTTINARRDELVARLRLQGYITATEAAKLAQVSAGQIGYLCSRGTLDAVRVKHMVFVTRASVDAWVTPRPYLDDETGAVTPRYVKARPEASRPGSISGRRGAK